MTFYIIQRCLSYNLIAITALIFIMLTLVVISFNFFPDTRGKVCVIQKDVITSLFFLSKGSVVIDHFK